LTPGRPRAEPPLHEGGGYPGRLSRWSAIITDMPVSPGTNRDAALLEGALERITYANPETGYTIARIDAGRGPDLITVVGPLLCAQVGESLRLRGRRTSHPKYGKQFEVFSYTTVLPATVQGIGSSSRTTPRQPPARPGTGGSCGARIVDPGFASVDWSSL
jgi:hypothetical protein